MNNQQETLVTRRGEPQHFGSTPSGGRSYDVDQAQVPDLIKAGMRRRAQLTSGVGDVSFEGVTGSFFSPFRIRPSLEAPTKRVDLNEWFRYYAAHDPVVGTAIELHAYFPLSKFEIEHDDSALAELFNDEKELLELEDLLPQMGLEWWLVGEAFPFGFLDDPDDPSRFERFILLDPDKIRINRHPLAQGKNNRDYIIRMQPDADLKKIVQNGPNDPHTGELYRNIPNDIIDYVKTGKTIPLHPLQVSHFKRVTNPFNVRGQSLLSRVLQDLMLLDKYRDAQWAIADRHITPTEYYLIGEPGYPADDAELQAFRDVLTAGWTQYNRAYVWHHAVNIQIHGANGKILPLSSEYDYLEKRILSGLMMNKAFLTGEGPCLREDHDILTEQGWMPIAGVPDGTRLMTYNKDTGEAELQHFVNRIVQDYDGDLVHFETNKIDCVVTPNHRMLAKPKRVRTKQGHDLHYDAQTLPDGSIECVICGTPFKRTHQTGRPPKVCSPDCGRQRGKLNGQVQEEYYGDWEVIPASDIKTKAKFPVRAQWNGDNSRGFPLAVDVGNGNKVELRTYLRFAGWYASEGWANEKRIGANQTTHQDGFEAFCEDMKAFEQQAGIRFCESDSVLASGSTRRTFISLAGSGAVAQYFTEFWGRGSHNKRIPSWVKALPPDYLRELLDTMVLGDGSCRPVRKDQDEEDDRQYFGYYTVSEQLADDVQEIAWKVGFSPRITVQKASEDRKSDKYCVYWSEADRYGVEPLLNRNDQIKSIPHNGKVYCYQVPNEFLVVRRNGKMLIVGNTYANASVAMDVLITRYMEYRDKIERWLTKAVFEPLCRMNNIYKPTEAELSHRIRIRNPLKRPWTPRISWARPTLRDDTFKIQLYERLANQLMLPRNELYRALNKNPKQIRAELLEQRRQDEADRSAGGQPPGAPPTGMGLPTGIPGGGGGLMGPGGRPMGLPNALPQGAPQLPIPGTAGPLAGGPAGMKPPESSQPLPQM